MLVEIAVFVDNFFFLEITVFRDGVSIYMHTRIYIYLYISACGT